MQTKEERVAYLKQYRKDNKEKRAAYLKQYRKDNKEDIAAYNKQYREDNKEDLTAYLKKYREDNKKDIAVMRHARHLEIFEYKGGACAHCSVRELDYLSMYDYHHIDPATKLYGVSRIIQGSMDRLLTEVDKCLLLCANCHRKEHARLFKENLNE
jgi:hypothetical protein